MRSFLLLALSPLVAGFGSFNIVSTILTEDAGVETDSGFLLLGRADGADAKGCSMAVEEFMKATEGMMAG